MGSESMQIHFVAIEHAYRKGQKRYRYVIWRNAEGTNYRQFLLKSLFGFKTEELAKQEAELFLHRHGYAYQWVSQS